MSLLQVFLVIHVAAALLSPLLLLSRVALALRAAAVPSRTLMRGALAVDALLLASALALCVLIGQFPLQQPWLTGKLLALLAYMGLGHAAAGRTRTAGARWLLLLLALVALGYAYAVALRADATPW